MTAVTFFVSLCPLANIKNGASEKYKNLRWLLASKRENGIEEVALSSNKGAPLASLTLPSSQAPQKSVS